MSVFQKYARFQLIVTLITLVVVLTILLIPAISSKYLAGFSILSFLGLGESYFKRSGQSPIKDERDEQINHKALLLAYSVFWICFVTWGVTVTLLFSSSGSVPLVFVESVVLLSWCVVTVVYSSMVLVLYR